MNKHSQVRRVKSEMSSWHLCPASDCSTKIKIGKTSIVWTNENADKAHGHYSEGRAQKVTLYIQAKLNLNLITLKWKEATFHEDHKLYTTGTFSLNNNNQFLERVFRRSERLFWFCSALSSHMWPHRSFCSLLRLSISGTSDSTWSRTRARSGFDSCRPSVNPDEVDLCVPAAAGEGLQLHWATCRRLIVQTGGVQTVPDIQHEDTIKMTPYPTLSLRLRTKIKLL